MQNQKRTGAGNVQSAPAVKFQSVKKEKKKRKRKSFENIYTRPSARRGQHLGLIYVKIVGSSEAVLWWIYRV